MSHPAISVLVDGMQLACSDAANTIYVATTVFHTKQHPVSFDHLCLCPELFFSDEPNVLSRPHEGCSHKEQDVALAQVQNWNKLDGAGKNDLIDLSVCVANIGIFLQTQVFLSTYYFIYLLYFELSYQCAMCFSRACGHWLLSNL